jgi:hypothetical protein
MIEHQVSKSSNCVSFEGSVADVHSLRNCSDKSNSATCISPLSSPRLPVTELHQRDGRVRLLLRGRSVELPNELPCLTFQSLHLTRLKQKKKTVQRASAISALARAIFVRGNTRHKEIENDPPNWRHCSVTPVWPIDASLLAAATMRELMAMVGRHMQHSRVHASGRRLPTMTTEVGGSGQCKMKSNEKKGGAMGGRRAMCGH